ncbi:MAG TPA: aminopeptidase N [Gammaproteobacteria bacterium]|nr:aminopeptidase N [Gammaproteobacteria bacterium]
MTTPHKITYRKDYTKPAYEITDIHLEYTLGEDFTDVTASTHFIQKQKEPLVLMGRELELLGIKLNGKEIKYTQDSESLTISNPPEDFVLDIKTRIHPEKNTSLEGLYKVKNLFCTQCESEGFRKMTYYLDRPDVMAKFTTKIIADKKLYPILLSNGNLINHGDLKNNLHFAEWQDPFRKPCYLFALVAGDLACVSDKFKTMSGRVVDIKLYVEKNDEDKTAFALQSIKRAMKWDEENYGREYDLDIFMVVATHDFNFGAMENKGLNIFNSKYILAKTETATDEDYIAIERVIGHEYFHNWTGDRITCRDWFQLSLKESLTVFRDSSFSADMNSAAVVRINDVNTLRSVQFPQDAGPMAHPVRPESYMEINNFYTVTVYEKGAEVIRMLSTLLGKDGFRKGMDLYFNTYDGQAVTIDDFVDAHAKANHKDLSAFMAWYEKSGTPELIISTSYVEEKKQYFVKITQPGHSFLMPFKMGLLDSHGKEIAARTLEIKNPEEVFVFDNISEKPIPSLLRDFSAPIKFKYDYTTEELAFLLQHDTDAVSRWDAGQQLSIRIIQKLMGHSQDSWKSDKLLTKSWQTILEDKKLDPAFAAHLLVLPTENYLMELFEPLNLDKLLAVRKFLRNHLAHNLHDLFLERFGSAEDSIPGRALKNRCLSYLGVVDSAADQDIILHQLTTAKNMTDEIAALSAISQSSSSLREEALEKFYIKYKSERLVIDKWFGIQARSELPGAIDRVKLLTHHNEFDIKNPNRVRALIGNFCQNLNSFHALDGSGYKLLEDIVINLNKINPKVAARLIEPFTRYKKYDENRQALIKTALENIKKTPELSVDLIEVVTKTL